MSTGQRGFTLIELILAMAVFSMMLLIIVSGFINVVHLHNRAIALNQTQDNARAAMDQIVQAVRNSSNGSTPNIQGSAPLGASLCVSSVSGPDTVFFIDAVTYSLMRADGCVARLNAEALTNPNVVVTNFAPTVESVSGSAGTKPQVDLALTVATSNGTTDPATNGEGVKCAVGTSTQTFCSVVTFKSGVTPR